MARRRQSKGYYEPQALRDPGCALLLWVLIVGVVLIAIVAQSIR